MKYMHKPATMMVLALSAAVLASCSSPKPERKPAAPVRQSALSIMERVAISANHCWFKSNDADFRQYRLAPELNSFSGRPRILLVPQRNPNDRPLLVVQAEGSPAQMERFGPMMSSPLAARIIRDTDRWASGQKAC